MGYSLPGSSVHGILQARILEWGTVPFSMDLPTQGSKLCFPHCKQILCLLSHQGSPIYCDSRNKFLMTKLAVFKLFFLSYGREICGMTGGGGRDLKTGRATDSKWGKRKWFHSGSSGGREVQKDTVQWLCLRLGTWMSPLPVGWGQTQGLPLGTLLSENRNLCGNPRQWWDLAETEAYWCLSPLLDDSAWSQSHLLRVPSAQLRERIAAEHSRVELERRTRIGLLCWKWLWEGTPPCGGEGWGGKGVEIGHFVRIHAVYSAWMFCVTVYLFLLPGLQYVFLTLQNLQDFYFFLKLILKIVDS